MVERMMKRKKLEKIKRDDAVIPRVDLTGIQRPKIIDNPKAYRRIKIDFNKEMEYEEE
jgi:hypothetical protein